MTEEEINKLLDPLIKHYNLTERAKQRFASAMQEAVEIGSIGFADWLQENEWHDWIKGHWLKEVPGQDHDQATTKELFDQYIKSLEK